MRRLLPLRRYAVSPAAGGMPPVYAYIDALYALCDMLRAMPLMPYARCFVVVMLAIMPMRRSIYGLPAPYNADSCYAYAMPRMPDIDACCAITLDKMIRAHTLAYFRYRLMLKRYVTRCCRHMPLMAAGGLRKAQQCGG